MEVMMRTQGFVSTLFGRRTRNLGRGGRRVGVTAVEAPLGGMALSSYSMQIRVLSERHAVLRDSAR